MIFVILVCVIYVEIYIIKLSGIRVFLCYLFKIMYLIKILGYSVVWV